MAMQTEKLCILGCGGFIGSHLLESLLLKPTPYQITGIDLSAEKINHLLDKPQFTFIKSDLYSLKNLSEIIQDCDTVISLTAICNPSLYNKQPVDVIEANYTHPAEIVKLCSKHGKRLIHFSTSEVYGKTPTALDPSLSNDNYIMKEESTHMILGAVSKQRWTYACAKQLLERLIYGYAYEGKLDFTIVRPFNFIGSRFDYIPSIDGHGIPRVFSCFMESLFFNKPLLIVDGGEAKRLFTYIDDAIDATMRIIERPEACKNIIFNIGHTDNEASMRELAELMVKLYPKVSGRKIGDKCTIKNISHEEFYGNDYDDCDRRLADISLAKSLLDWSPKTSFNDTVEKTMAGYIEHYMSGEHCHA